VVHECELPLFLPKNPPRPARGGQAKFTCPMAGGLPAVGRGFSFPASRSPVGGQARLVSVEINQIREGVFVL